MVENRHRIQVNIKSNMFRAIPEVVANDKVIFEIEVWDGATRFPLLETYSYKLTSLKLGGQSVIRDGTLSGDLIVFELGTSEMTVPGKVEGTVQIFDENNDRISSAKFDYVVKRDPSLQGSLPTDNTSLVIANESLLTESIQKSDTAITDSSTALTKATTAETTANTVKQQFDEVTKASTIDPQVSQALVASDGKTYVNLSARFDKTDEVLAERGQEIANLQTSKAEQSALNTTNTNLTNGLASKVDKNGVEQVTWGMLAQDAKTQITGGNTAVVGENAVSTINIVNNSMTSAKRTTLGEEAYLYTASPVNVDFVGGKVDIPSGVKFVVWRNKSYTLSSSAISIPKSGSTLAGHLVFNWATNTVELLTTAQVTENHVSLGYIHTTVRVLNFAYTVNGKADIVGTIDNVTSKWANKKAVTFGDSITWYDGNTFVNTHREYGTVAKGYQSYMREKLQCTVDNQGYSGADITQILSSKILPYDFTNTDFATITSGANDHRKGIPLGVIGATGGTYNTSTFAGALQKAIEHILAAKPTIQIYLITPIKGWYHESGTSDVPGPYKNEMMISSDYVNAIKELGELYSLPVCDWYYLSGINNVTKDTLIGDNDAVFTAYDLHPTNEGFRRMGSVLIPFLNNY